MHMQRIGRSAAVLLVDGEELRRRNMTAEKLDERQAASLLEATGWSGARFELYAGRDSVLLFAWESAEKPNLFWFGDIDSLLDGAACCPDCPSELIAYAGGYILVVYTAEGERPCAALCEFGEPRRASAEFLTHLEEQGRVLEKKNALRRLKTLLRA